MLRVVCHYARPETVCCGLPFGLPGPTQMLASGGSPPLLLGFLLGICRSLPCSLPSYNHNTSLLFGYLGNLRALGMILNLCYQPELLRLAGLGSSISQMLLELPLCLSRSYEALSQPHPTAGVRSLSRVGVSALGFGTITLAAQLYWEPQKR